MTTDASNKKRLPTGLELTNMDERYRESPHPILDQLREKDPVHYHELIEQYVLFRHEDVERVLQDRGLFVDPRKAPEGNMRAERMRRARAENPDAGDRNPSMLMLDPPDHDRLRALVNRAFTPRSVEVMRPRTQAIADHLLADFGDGGSSVAFTMSKSGPHEVLHPHGLGR